MSEAPERILAVANGLISGHWNARTDNDPHPLETEYVREDLATSQGAMGWQPIETAPMDGTWILVYAPDGLGPLKPTADLTHWIVKQGWAGNNFGWIDQDDAQVFGNYDPTHWMQLPLPPMG